MLLAVQCCGVIQEGQQGSRCGGTLVERRRLFIVGQTHWWSARTTIVQATHWWHNSTAIHWCQEMSISLYIVMVSCVSQCKLPLDRYISMICVYFQHDSESKISRCFAVLRYTSMFVFTIVFLNYSIWYSYSKECWSSWLFFIYVNKCHDHQVSCNPHCATYLTIYFFYTMCFLVPVCKPL